MAEYDDARSGNPISDVAIPTRSWQRRVVARNFETGLVDINIHSTLKEQMLRVQLWDIVSWPKQTVQRQLAWNPGPDLL
jgi:hypothetical protein